MNQPFVERRKVAIAPALMTEDEVAKRLNVSVASLRRWRLLGKGPVFIKVGSLVRYRAEDLDSWLATLPQGGSTSRARVGQPHPGPTQAGRASEGRREEEEERRKAASDGGLQTKTQGRNIEVSTSASSSTRASGSRNPLAPPARRWRRNTRSGARRRWSARRRACPQSRKPRASAR